MLNIHNPEHIIWKNFIKNIHLQGFASTKILAKQLYVTSLAIAKNEKYSLLPSIYIFYKGPKQITNKEWKTTIQWIMAIINKTRSWVTI